MGKFPESTIHGQYSDWHYQLIQKDAKYKKLYVSDIDRLWIEYDFNRNALVCVIDIKWEDSLDNLTATEVGIYKWFRNRGVDVYMVYISKDFSRFTVVDADGEEYTLSENDYAEWLYYMRIKAKRDNEFLERHAINKKE